MSRIAPKAAPSGPKPVMISKIENADNQMHPIHQADIHTKFLQVLDKPAAELHPPAAAQAPASNAGQAPAPQ